jgi:hypothetical protein
LGCCDVGLVGRSGVGLKYDGPLSGHLTQVGIELDVFHAPTSAAEKAPRFNDGV